MAYIRECVGNPLSRRSAGRAVEGASWCGRERHTGSGSEQVCNRRKKGKTWRKEVVNKVATLRQRTWYCRLGFCERNADEHEECCCLHHDISVVWRASVINIVSTRIYADLKMENCLVYTLYAEAGNAITLPHSAPLCVCLGGVLLREAVHLVSPLSNSHPAEEGSTYRENEICEQPISIFVEFLGERIFRWPRRRSKNH